MDQFFDWFSSSVRSIGASFPFAASLVQAQAEIDAKQIGKDVKQIKDRLERIEDPISNLHEDARKISKEIFDKMVELNSKYLEFDEEFYAENNRVLTILDSKGLLKGQGNMTKRHYTRIILTNPVYVLYLCDLFIDKSSMEKLYETVDSCHLGEVILSKKLQEELSLPFPVIEAMFKIFEAKGLGFIDEFPGNNTRYMGKA